MRVKLTSLSSSKIAAQLDCAACQGKNHFLNQPTNFMC